MRCNGRSQCALVGQVVVVAGSRQGMRELGETQRRKERCDAINKDGRSDGGWWRLKVERRTEEERDGSYSGRVVVVVVAVTVGQW